MHFAVYLRVCCLKVVIGCKISFAPINSPSERVVNLNFNKAIIICFTLICFAIVSGLLVSLFIWVILITFVNYNK